MKEGYAHGEKGYNSRSGGAHGPGGLKAAASRSANPHPGPNPAPCGPYAHELGMTGDGGMHGDTTVSHRGNKFNFK